MNDWEHVGEPQKYELPKKSVVLEDSNGNQFIVQLSSVRAIRYRREEYRIMDEYDYCNVELASGTILKVLDVTELIEEWKKYMEEIS